MYVFFSIPCFWFVSFPRNITYEEQQSDGHQHQLTRKWSNTFKALILTKNSLTFNLYPKLSLKCDGIMKFFPSLCSVQLLSHVRLFATPWTAARQASLSITNSQSPPKPMSIKSVMPSSHLILCPSHSHPSPPALNLSQHQGLFKRVSSSHQVAKVLEFQLQHQSFQWTPRNDLL